MIIKLWLKVYIKDRTHPWSSQPHVISYSLQYKILLICDSLLDSFPDTGRQCLISVQHCSYMQCWMHHETINTCFLIHSFTIYIGAAVTHLSCMWSHTLWIWAWLPTFLTEVYCFPCLLRWNLLKSIMTTSIEILIYSPFMATFPSYSTLFNPCSWNGVINLNYTGIGSLNLPYYGHDHQILSVGRGQLVMVLALKNIYIFESMTA